MKKKVSFRLIYPLKNQRGFASFAFFMILPIFLALMFGFSFLSYFIDSKTQVRSLCLSKTILIQKELIASEKKLFSLNPLSTLLRNSLRLAYGQLALGLATQNSALIAKSLIEIQKIKAQQKQLDILQKSLLLAAKINLQLRMQDLKNELSLTFQKSKDIWFFYLNSFYQIEQIGLPELAVVADAPDWAPNYELKKDYRIRQSLAFKWQHRFSTKSSAQQILQTENTYTLSCGSKPLQQEKTWSVEINEGKF